MRLILFLALLTTPIASSIGAEQDRSIRLYPGGGNGTDMEKKIHEHLHGKLRSIKHFYLAGGFVVCRGPALHDSVNVWLNEFVAQKTKAAFSGIDIVSFPSGNEFLKIDKTKWGNLEVRLIMVPTAGFVSYHLRLMISRADATETTPYVDETVGVVSIKDAYERDTFSSRISTMIDDAAIFMAGPR